MVEEGHLKIYSIKVVRPLEEPSNTLLLNVGNERLTTIRGVVIQEKWLNLGKKSSECYDVFHLP